MNKYYESYEKFFGREAALELEKLYGIFDAGTLTWAARLLDPEIGGFYYSNSARDNEGFLPDVESTTQLVGVLSGADFGKYGSADNAFPEQM